QFINPFLLFHLENTLELTIPPFEDFAEFNLYLVENGLSVENETSVIGNFHHHRYQIVKELEDLIKLDKYSSSLSNLLGFGNQSDATSFSLIADNLFFADIDHETVFESISKNDTVIQ